MEHSNIDSIYFQSHRGGLYDRPENTMAAYKYSWSLKGAIPEIDVRTTSDGVMVCLHDNRLKRTTNAPLNIAYQKISKLKSSQILLLDAGIKFKKEYEREHIPTLKEVFSELRKVQTRQLYLDVKNLDYISLKDMIKEYQIEEQIIFVHGDLKKCKSLLELYTNARTMTWLSGNINRITNKYRSISKSGFNGLTQLQLHLHAHRIKDKIIYDLNKDFLLTAVKETSNSNIDLMVRPFLFDHESLIYLLSLGIKWFAIDEPGLFVKIIEEISV